MKRIILISALMVWAGCSTPTGSKETKETKKFDLPSSGGYHGTPVGNCSKSEASDECRKLGWDGAIDYTCGTVHVTGGFFGPFDQDVMYTVTCYRD